MKASTSVVYMFSFTTSAMVMPAPASTASRLSSAWLTWATMSPAWIGAPSASTEVWPEQCSVRRSPLTSTACWKPISTDHGHGLIARRSIGRQ